MEGRFECKPRCARAEPRLVGAVHVVAVQGHVAHAVHRLRARHPAEPARRLAHDDLHAHRRRLYAALTLAQVTLLSSRGMMPLPLSATESLCHCELMLALRARVAAHSRAVHSLLLCVRVCLYCLMRAQSMHMAPAPSLIRRRVLFDPGAGC